MTATVKNNTVSDLIVAMLQAQGVKRVYGYLGASIVPFLKSVEKLGMQFVLCRTEGNAALAASAEAKVTGQLAVVCTTSGPGASNLVTGLLDAQHDHVPVLAITGDLATFKRGCESEFQELDHGLLFAAVVGTTATLSHPEAAPTILRTLIGKALNDHSCVHLCLPSDIQSVVLPDHLVEASLHSMPIKSLRDELPGRVSDSLIGNIVQAMVDPQVTVAIVVGGGAYGVGKQVCQLAELIGAPVIVTLDGKGVVPDTHPNTIGVLGIFGSPAFSLSQDALAGVSRIVAIGVSNPAPFIIGEDGLTVARSLVMIEKDFSATGHNLSDPSMTLIGPLPSTLATLITHVSTTIAAHEPKQLQVKLLEDMRARKKEFFDQYTRESQQQQKFAHPVSLLSELSKQLAGRKHKSIMVPDVGDHTVWTALFTQFANEEKMVISDNLGVMGWCLPGAIACKLAHPEATVLSIAGDGGVMMSIQELSTAVQEGTSFILIIFNNTRLKRVAGSPFTVLGPRVDFVKLAESVGASGNQITTNNHQEIETVLTKAFNHVDQNKGPYVIDVNIDPETAAPMSSWKYQHEPLSFK